MASSHLFAIGIFGFMFFCFFFVFHIHYRPISYKSRFPAVPPRPQMPPSTPSPPPVTPTTTALSLPLSQQSKQDGGRPLAPILLTLLAHLTSLHDPTPRTFLMHCYSLYRAGVIEEREWREVWERFSGGAMPPDLNFEQVMNPFFICFHLCCFVFVRCRLNIIFSR